MKDTLSYALFRRFGVPAPLTSYVWLTVNGEDRGLYLAVEDLSDGFLDRNFGGEGVIYKPESKNLKLTLDAVRESRIKGLDVSSDPHGSDLLYTDDDPESYPDIFDNAETHAEPEDSAAVIAALKCLSARSSPPPTKWTPATSCSWSWALSWSVRNSSRWLTRSPAAENRRHPFRQFGEL